MTNTSARSKPAPKDSSGVVLAANSFAARTAKDPVLSAGREALKTQRLLLPSSSPVTEGDRGLLAKDKSPQRSGHRKEVGRHRTFWVVPSNELLVVAYKTVDMEGEGTYKDTLDSVR